MTTNNMDVAGTPCLNNCALHWLQMSLPVDTTLSDGGLERICNDLFNQSSTGFETSRNTLRGFTSYKTRRDHQGITILTDHYANGGIMILLTGSVCDTIAPDLEFIAQYLSYHGGKVSRIDIAVDDHVGLLDIAAINRARLDNTCITSFQKARAIDESNLKTGSTTAPTIVFGSEKSDLQIRFYDRAAKNGLASHWVRCELQCRNAYATAVMKQLEEGNTLATVAMGVLRDKLSFRVPKGENRKRWKICGWWSEFLQDTERLSLGICKDRQETSIQKQLKWLEKTAAKTLATIRRHYGIGKIEDLCDKGDMRLKARQHREQKQFENYREAA